MWKWTITKKSPLLGVTMNGSAIHWRLPTSSGWNRYRESPDISQCGLLVRDVPDVLWDYDPKPCRRCFRDPGFRSAVQKLIADMKSRKGTIRI